MGKAHVLAADNGKKYTVVIHTPTPTGNNSAGKSWKNAGLSAGILGTTTLVEGSGVGQITTAERNSIIAGDLVEIVAQFNAESGGATLSSLTEMVDKIISEWQTNMTMKLKYYGYVLP